MTLSPAELYAVLEATWPPAGREQHGPWCIRNGRGGGKRVSAATTEGAWTLEDFPAAEAAMQALGQPSLFLIRIGEAALDAALAARGYRVVDPVVAYAAACNSFAAPDPLTAFPHWPPLTIALDLWQAEGIGPERVAVMQRVAGPKTVILGRAGDRAAGAAFVALHGKTAMLHALEVAPDLRRQGTARNILRSAATWAQDNGADTLSLVVTAANSGARTLYASLGFQAMGQYHYRQK